MAKRKKLRFGKQARFDHAGLVGKVKLAIETDDQFHLQIYSTLFHKVPSVCQELLRREGITEERLVCLVKDKTKIDGLRLRMPHIFADVASGT